MEAKRKQGVCLPKSPLVQNRNVYPSASTAGTRISIDRAQFSAHKVEVPEREDAIRDEPPKQVQRDAGPIIRFPPFPLNRNGIAADQEPVEPFPYAGYAAQIMDSIMHSLCLLCIKLLPLENSLQEEAKACMIRGLLMMLLCAIEIVCKGHSFKVARGEYLLNFFRSLLGGLNILLTFLVLGYISIGESSAILYLSCIWTCLLGFVILNEPFQLSLVVSLPLSLLGVILLAKPGLIVDTSSEFTPLIVNQTTESELVQVANIKLNETTGLEPIINLIEEDYFEQRWPGIVLALASSFIISIVIIILKLRKKTPIITCSFYLGFAIALVGLGTQMVVGFGTLPSSLLECSLHLCIGLLSFGSQCLFQWSLIYVKAGSYSVIQSLEIVLGFVLGALFLRDLVPWTSVTGSALIIVVVIMLVFNDFLLARLKSLFSN